jgi:hypothetical protein
MDDAVKRALEVFEERVK